MAKETSGKIMGSIFQRKLREKHPRHESITLQAKALLIGFHRNIGTFVYKPVSLISRQDIEILTRLIKCVNLKNIGKITSIKRLPHFEMFCKLSKQRVNINGFKDLLQRCAFCI